MRYFTEELWSMLNNINTTKEANRRWSENEKEYNSRYPQLKSKLSKGVYEYL
jgi:hypothetical protein